MAFLQVKPQLVAVSLAEASKRNRRLSTSIGLLFILWAAQLIWTELLANRSALREAAIDDCVSFSLRNRNKVLDWAKKKKTSSTNNNSNSLSCTQLTLAPSHLNTHLALQRLSQPVTTCTGSSLPIFLCQQFSPNFSTSASLRSLLEKKQYWTLCEVS